MIVADFSQTAITCDVHTLSSYRTYDKSSFIEELNTHALSETPRRKVCLYFDLCIQSVRIPVEAPPIGFGRLRHYRNQDATEPI